MALLANESVLWKRVLETLHDKVFYRSIGSRDWVLRAFHFDR